MSEIRINPGTTAQPAEVFGTFDSNIKSIEKDCNVQIGIRGEEIIIAGQEIERAASIITEMYKVVESGHSLRILKTKARLEFLEEQFGFAFSQEDKEALFALDNPGKPHIANLMIRCGYASTKEEAIKTYIDQKRFRSSYVRPEAAIEGILKSGGIPVLAHPSYGSGGEMILGNAMDERLRHLLFYGLQGVEAYYSGFTKRLQEEMLSFAEKYDLYVTAGSDYHGWNKLVQLGENNLAEVSQGAPGLHRFLRDVQDRIL